MEEKRTVEWLDAELARRADAARRIAGSLLELEQHPGHVLLTAGPTTGRTAERWTAAAVTLAGLWRDFDTYRATVQAAEQVRARRARPGDRELAELHQLLVAPSVEVGRRAVGLSDRGLTGDTEHVDTLSLTQLATRMDAAFTEVSALVVRCDAVHTAFVGGLTPRAERLVAARGLVAGTGLGPTDPDAAAVAALTSRVAELGRAAATDPLSLDGGAPSELLAALDRDITDVTGRLHALAAVRSCWDGRLADLTAALERTDRLRAEVESTAVRAAELVAGPGPALPADRLPELRAALTRLPATHGWRERAATGDALRRALDDTEAELHTAHDLATGLLERREELRGRFTAYRARATRLGRAEDTALLALDTDIQRLLWSRPADLAAATRALAGYRRLLGEAAGPASGRSA